MYIFAPMKEEAETVKIIGPVIRDMEGNVKGTYVPREIPKRTWETGSSDLKVAGMMLADDLNTPSSDGTVRGPGRKSNAEKQLEAALAQLAELKAKMEEKEAAEMKETKPSKDAGKA